MTSVQLMDNLNTNPAFIYVIGRSTILFYWVFLLFVTGTGDIVCEPRLITC